ncbi:MFS transporter [Cellulomonas sp. NPDC089187]|uniref:MFS transporter n=1 Tax=Cellulomonas sp. NPDC089187 TaxID=3154970 RepID=UPI00343E4B5B
MKRSFSFIAAGTLLIAATYGLVRLAYGLYLPDMQATLGFDDGAAGLISSGGSLVYCAGALVGVATATRFPRALVAAAGLTAATGSLGMALASGTALLAAAAVLSSAGAGLASPALVETVRRSVPAADRDRAQTLVNSGTGPGLIAAGILALALLPHWRAGWWVAAGVSLCGALAVLTTSRSRRSAGSRVDLLPVQWLRTHRAPMIAALLLGAGSAAVWSFGRNLLDSAGSTSTLAWIALGVGGTLVLPTAPLIVRLRVGHAWALTTGSVAVSTLVLPLLVDHLPLALLACTLFGWGYTAATGVLITWTGRLDPNRAATGTAVLFVLLVLGQAIGAAAVGALMTSSTVAFTAAGLTAALSTCLAATAPQPSRQAT